jgi:uncharacterized protein YdeI (YjbR/CyaY-like superfamily)
MQPTHFGSAAKFRAWLRRNHDKVEEVWVALSNRRASSRSLTYFDALDEALCFGWIDGVRKKLDDTSYAIRFTPRKSRSYWSSVNIRRAEALIKNGRMVAPGLKAFQERSRESGKYSFENRPQKLDAKYEREFRKNKTAWKFFQGQAPWYQRTASFWVMSARKEDTRQRRLAILMSDSACGRRLAILTPKNKNSAARKSPGK